MIGAGSVVTKDVGKQELWYGNPAKHKGYVCKCGQKCVEIWDGITLEDNVFIGPNVTFTNDFLPRSKQYPKEFLKTTIKKSASIGANSTIVGGITIGEYAMIGAGSVVTKDVGSQELWYGNPATHRGYVCKCGQKCDEAAIS